MADQLVDNYKLNKYNERITTNKLRNYHDYDKSISYFNDYILKTRDGILN